MTGQIERVARPSVGPFRHESRWMSHGLGAPPPYFQKACVPAASKTRPRVRGTSPHSCQGLPIQIGNPRIRSKLNPSSTMPTSVDAPLRIPEARSQWRGFCHRFNPTVRTVSLEWPYARGGIETFRRTPDRSL